MQAPGFFCCPECRSRDLGWAADLTPGPPPFAVASGLRCRACRREFPRIGPVWVLWSDELKAIQLSQPAADAELGTRVKWANVHIYDDVSSDFGEHRDGLVNHDEMVRTLKALAGDLQSRPAPGAERVLVDVGTGSGAGLELGSSGYTHPVGLDVSLANLETVAKKGFLAVLGDAERMPFADASIDLVTCFAAMHHLPSPAAFLREGQRVLRPGGTLATGGDPSAQFMRFGPLAKLVWDARKPVYRFLSRYSKRFFLHQSHEAQELNDLAEYQRTHGGFDEEALRRQLLDSGLADVNVFYGVDAARRQRFGLPERKVFLLRLLSFQNPFLRRNFQSLSSLSRKSPPGPGAAASGPASAPQAAGRPRIYLSVPHMGGSEEGYVRSAFASNWLSTVGPNIDAFEAEFADRIGLPAVAMASGTAALHLGLRLLGTGPGDEVLCPTLTFAASANPVVYQGARPVFIDSERESWNMDPNLLADALKARATRNCLPRAVIVVHLYGQCADMDPILEVCGRYGVPVLEDAAEALGASYKGRPAGSMGAVGIFSFNGNKVITTTGGGMLVAQDPAHVQKARFWAMQARDPGVAYEHSEIGYNYRLSNVLAGIGRGQLEVLDDRVRRRRAIAFRYRDAFQDLPGLSLMPEREYGLHSYWLSCFLVDASQLGIDRDGIIQALAARDIESRPVWKPMHLQPLYRAAARVHGETAEDLFMRGICLPSSSSLPAEHQDEVIATLRGAVNR